MDSDPKMAVFTALGSVSSLPATRVRCVVHDMTNHLVSYLVRFANPPTVTVTLQVGHVPGKAIRYARHVSQLHGFGLG